MLLPCTLADLHSTTKSSLWLCTFLHILSISHFMFVNKLIHCYETVCLKNVTSVARSIEFFFLSRPVSKVKCYSRVRAGTEKLQQIKFSSLVSPNISNKNFTKKFPYSIIHNCLLQNFLLVYLS